jgi:FdhD protein
MSGPQVDEILVQLLLNGAEAQQWRCTPTDVEALAIGRLFIEGVIRKADEAHLIVDRSRAGLLVRARIESTAAQMRTTPDRALGIPDAAIFNDLFRTLFTSVDARYEHGGMHAAAATDGQRIIKQVEDVGRHNTIDKIVGALLLDELSPGNFGLLTSSRVSGEIANKAVRAGFSWLASRSIPTTLAVAIATEARMPIIGRAPSKDAHIYV